MPISNNGCCSKSLSPKCQSHFVVVVVAPASLRVERQERVLGLENGLSSGFELHGCWLGTEPSFAGMEQQNPQPAMPALLFLSLF